jgi:hypothetical protein
MPKMSAVPLQTGSFKVKSRKGILLSCLFILLLCFEAGPLFAATINLPETGQSGCWDASGNPIACTGTGQDADKMQGAAWPSPRFTDNGNGTVTDKLTGLIWLKNANCTDTVGGIAKGSGYLTWAGALIWSNNLANGNCGLSDGSAAGQWRLPTVSELQSLVNSQQTNQGIWLNGQGFSSVQSSNYWSSTTYAPYTSYAWLVYMNVGSVYYGYKTGSYYVWPVRGGQ